MRWTNLLFAHWPIAEKEIAPLIPDGFSVDTFDGSAWAGVVPFRMEGVRLRGLPKVPGTHCFPEANVRTYVRDKKSGHHGVYFFSLDASNLLAVGAARGWYRLPYFFARMRIGRDKEWLEYRSRRLFTREPARLKLRYRGLGAGSASGSPLEEFLTARYALFTSGRRGRLMRADVHHLPWPLERAEAEMEDLTLAAAQSVRLPAIAPILHFSRSLDVFAWAPKAIE